MSESGSAEHAALNRLVFELTLLSRHVSASVLRRTGFQLDRSAYSILTRLEIDPSLNLRELAESFGLDISTINRQVAAMLERGLVRRVPDPYGGIARKLRASDTGLALLAADREQRRGEIGAVVADWSGADIAQMIRLVARFNESVERIEDNQSPRPPAAH
ncbi:MarR family winged helix-turn-helix transcriptional regulator [Nocardia sp. NBC_00881]|uniref:MarR family winged helix-turn-helix transcriptional regulator n=1 Tax=Nocardia sp. NBC_00881 TaxID=2975995 RepID=UPI003863184B|nr:MarR family winged helix-turn-helix transcriptional regulator [Nocardia sp. NBC_00881]